MTVSRERVRPSADQLLEKLRASDRARLRVYIGAAPGVGKTYAMLKDANALKQRGTDVVAGLVETYGRLDTEAQIVASLRQLFGPSQPYEQQCTVLLFSHRLLAFPQADLVVVLDHGHILEQGTHVELSAGNGLYARIYRAQRLASTASVTQGDTR